MRRVLFGLILFLSCTNLFAKEFIVAVNERSIFRYIDENGYWQGQDIDLLKAIFRRTPHSFKIISMPWPRVLKSIESGVVDLTLAAAILPEREAYALFSKNVFRYSHYMLFAHKDKASLFDDIRKLDDIKNHDVVIGALRGAVYTDTYYRLLKDPEFVKRIALIDDDQSLATLTIKGRVDAYIESEIEGKHYLGAWQQYHEMIVPLFRISTPLEAQNNLMFSKQSVSQALVDEFDIALKDLHESGEYEAISQKYLSIYTGSTHEKGLINNDGSSAP
ncbi:substrate-binding periplasmic protein [Alteromonas facilis]|uniref:substrate-binding periplasmic protein n=1 Tax=Alteromonas facilis TaxID=2048004 RepID=UPI000C2948BE|nr:transporter substrate-binding domain-containing protein [Alteromonas facilis]